MNIKSNYTDILFKLLKKEVITHIEYDTYTICHSYEILNEANLLKIDLKIILLYLLFMESFKEDSFPVSPFKITMVYRFLKSNHVKLKLKHFNTSIPEVYDYQIRDVLNDIKRIIDGIEK